MLLIIQGPTFAQRSDRYLQTSDIYKDEYDILNGTVSQIGNHELADVRIQIAIRAIEEDQWRVHEGLIELRPKGTKGRRPTSYAWRATGVRFGLLDDYEQEYEAVVILALKRRPIRGGIINYSTLVNSALAISDSKRIIRRKDSVSGPEPVPRIRITHVGSQTYDPKQIYTISPKEEVKGRLSIPKNSFVHLVVQLSEEEDRWIMDGTQWGKESWNSPAYFGRSELDLLKIYYAYAIITNQKLPIGKISAGQWYRYAKNNVIAKSNVIRTKPFEPEIHITHIGAEKFDSTKAYAIKQEEAIKGVVNIPKGAFVYMVIQPTEGDNRWIMHGTQWSNGQWDSPAYFGQDEWDLLKKYYAYAVIAKAKIPPGPVSPELWYQFKRDHVIAKSEIIKTAAFKPEIHITHVDKIPVDTDQMYQVKYEQRISGSVQKLNNMHVHFIVEPVESDTRWIMDKTQWFETNWYSLAIFGAHEFDYLKEFYAYAVISKHSSIPGVISWAQYEKDYVVAKSEILRVIRPDADSDQNLSTAQIAGSEVLNEFKNGQLNIEITGIDPLSGLQNYKRDSIAFQRFDHRHDLIICPHNQIRGRTKGRALKADEQVFVFVMNVQKDGYVNKWRLLGRAKKHFNSWTLHYGQEIGKNRERLILMAVVARASDLDLNNKSSRKSIIASSQKLPIFINYDCQ